MGIVFKNLHTRLKPKPEHLKQALAVLSSGKLYSPTDLAKSARLSLTAAKCVIEQLANEERLDIERQESSPRLRVRLLDSEKNV